MKFNMICIKCGQKEKKPKNLNFGLLSFLGFFKPTKPRFFSKPFYSPGAAMGR